MTLYVNGRPVQDALRHPRRLVTDPESRPILFNSSGDLNVHGRRITVVGLEPLPGFVAVHLRTGDYRPREDPPLDCHLRTANGHEFPWASAQSGGAPIEHFRTELFTGQINTEDTGLIFSIDDQEILIPLTH